MRKKEIEKASICQYQIIGTIGEQEAFKNGFVKGAEWADKTMIDKFLYWLTIKSPFIDNKDMDKAIVELKKYLEE